MAIGRRIITYGRLKTQTIAILSDKYNVTVVSQFEKPSRSMLHTFRETERYDVIIIEKGAQGARKLYSTLKRNNIPALTVEGEVRAEVAAQTIAKKAEWDVRTRTAICPVISGKGGVGKTTTASLLAYQMQRKTGSRILFVGDDPNQSHGRYLLGAMEASLLVHPSKYKDYIYRCKRAAVDAIFMDDYPSKEEMPQVKTSLGFWQSITESGDYDYIIVDTHPGFAVPDHSSINAFSAGFLSLPLLISDALAGNNVSLPTVLIALFTPTPVGLTGLNYVWEKATPQLRKWILPTMTLIKEDMSPLSVADELPKYAADPVLVPYNHEISTKHDIRTYKKHLFLKDPLTIYDDLIEAVVSMAEKRTEAY